MEVFSVQDDGDGDKASISKLFVYYLSPFAVSLAQRACCYLMRLMLRFSYQ